jgi:hypothetical protein
VSLEDYAPLITNEYTRVYQFKDEGGRDYVLVTVMSIDMIKESTFRFFEANGFERVSVAENGGTIQLVYKKYL